MTRHWSYCLAILVGLSSLASADLKIKTRTTVMGHTSESTVLIKGPRERNETSFGGRGGSITITQCDQKRVISVMGNQCTVMQMGGETSCPATPNMKSMGRMIAGGEPEAPRKGGIVTVTRNSTDTGERQEMFGYKARHVKSSMVMESSPDACNQSHMKMEIDGWYADLAGFSCGEDSSRNLACGGMGGKSGCSDRIIMKGGGGASMGYPLKQTTTMVSEQGTFTITTEVLDITNASLDSPLFDMPPGCKVMDMSAMTGSATGGTASAAAETASTAGAATVPASPAVSAKPAAPAPPAAPVVAPKTAGVVRVGVVKIKDMSGQSLPIDNLRLNLMSEIGRHQVETVPLDAEAPHAEVESEARAKQCDYIVYTMPMQVKDPSSGGLPAASVPKGVVLDPAKYQALTDITLYKVGKPTPELKNFAIAADATQLDVNAVMATFVQESDRVAQQIAEDSHPKPAAKTAKAPAKLGASSKPK